MAYLLHFSTGTTEAAHSENAIGSIMPAPLDHALHMVRSGVVKFWGCL